MHRTQAALFGLRLGHATVEDVWKAACEDIVAATGVSRASVWAFAEDGDRLICRNLFDGVRREHRNGAVLLRADHPAYFRAITNNAKVVASDALNHPATKGFADGYFQKDDVRSLLDFIVLNGTAPVGVLCCEQSGTIREWGQADLACLQSIAMSIGDVFLKSGGAV